MIHVQEASKAFGRTRAVQGVSFRLEPGRITGLLGPNGAGKTTTIRMIAGYLAPDSGAISVNGIDAAADPIRARRQIGYLPESAPLYPEMKPGQYLEYRARLFNLGRTDRRRAVASAMERCRLTDVAPKRIGVLSKGYRQRVGLAAAILHDPPVLILDEPTNGLDPAQIRATRGLIAELARDRTVLLCTHIIPEVERTCARALVIAEGRLIADGPPAELARAPAGDEMECRGPDDAPLRAALAARLGDDAPAVRTLDDGWLLVSGPAGSAEAMATAARDAGRGLRRLGPRTIPLEERIIGLIESAGGGA